jgi:EAL domain-containing protein (putative c-di-GMP-specific phosphodiesterase class I)
MNGRLEPFATMSVLVVDDNPLNVELLKQILKTEGLARVVSETDATRVATILPLVNPDLIVLDLHMPKIDGYALLDEIRAFAAGTYLPVLVITADASTDARNRALAHGARDFLTKPLDVTEVALRIANLLETRQLYADLRRTIVDPEAARSWTMTGQGQIQSVLTHSAITPVFQPVVDIDTRTNVGYEALARFGQPHKRGPAGWFEDAFQVGLGVQLEWLAVDQALPFLQAIGSGCFLALNMSPATILNLQRRPLCDAQLCPQIVIELTEHLPVQDYVALHDALQEMRAQGARLAADDLGAGYAGFRHLIALEPDIIKLDISLVNGIHRNRGARALSRALVAFATDVGAVVIAEGVEDSADLGELREIGVHWAQGYYLGRPEPAPLIGRSRV